MGNLSIIVIVILIVALAVKGSMAHFKGEGGCCGGGGDVRKVKPRKLESVVATRTITIEGMVCDNCATRIQNALNSIDGVSAKVQRSKNRAVVSLDREIDDRLLKQTITDLGYTVKEIV